MGKKVKLVYVAVEDGKTEQSNKYYEMEENDNGTYTATWGRIGAPNPSTQTKSMSEWQKTYNSKVKKGYTDHTELFIVEGKSSKKSGTVKDFLKSRTQTVIDLVKKLQGWAKGSIEQNYTVTSEQVTQKQIDRAQVMLNELTAIDVKDFTAFNKMLLEFFKVVPRKMKNVKDHIISADKLDENGKRITHFDQKNKIISDEQATLDVMSGQVLLNSNVQEQETDEPEIETDIIKASGLELKEVTDSSVISQIKNLMADNKSKFKIAFEVMNNQTQVAHTTHVAKAKNKKLELFWHGSRNENWWSIMTTGLLIRPSNAVHSGSMFGDGIYFADKFQKSFGYTSGRGSYYAGGSSNEAILALYDVHVGEQKHIKHHDSSCYSLSAKVLAKDGFDSVFAHGGADLRNNEYIVYQSPQSTIKYLVIVNA
jgi:poly [ADP-ribose] polymerase